MRILAATLAIGLLATTTTRADDGDAVGYVQAFCALAAVDGGDARAHLVTPELAAAIGAAMAENARLQAETPDEKPPFGDGVPWQSFPDGAPVCEAGAIVAEGDRVVAEVNYRFPDAKDGDWTDRLVFARGADGVMLIDDIRYGATGEESLRRTLKEAFAG